jgi:hypothetical protein
VTVRGLGAQHSSRQCTPSQLSIMTTETHFQNCSPRSCHRPLSGGPLHRHAVKGVDFDIPRALSAPNKTLAIALLAVFSTSITISAVPFLHGGSNEHIYIHFRICRSVRFRPYDALSPSTINSTSKLPLSQWAPGRRHSHARTRRLRPSISLMPRQNLHGRSDSVSTELVTSGILPCKRPMPT